MNNAKSKIKNLLKSKAPGICSKLSTIKYQTSCEIRTLYQAGLRTVISQLLPKRSNWRRVLPIQSPRSYSQSGFDFSTFEELKDHLVLDNVDFAEGAHTLYFGPRDWCHTDLAPLAKQYPLNAGIKIVKRLGGLKEPYVVPESSLRVQAFLLPSHIQQSLTMNALYLRGIAPRLYDLIEIDGGGTHCVAYVMQHLDGGVPATTEYDEFIVKLRKLIKERFIQLIVEGGFNNKDFNTNSCNGNLITDKSTGKTLYVDIQNFRLVDYGNYLDRIALKANDETHFGDKSYLLGGKYLYQAIPGVRLPAKRNSHERIKIIRDLLSRTGMNIKEKVVLDIGCNIGVMAAQYLCDGARWVHGWDFPEIVTHTEKIMLGIGCTRFSLTGTRLHSKISIPQDLPLHIRGNQEYVISYLSIERHIGWIEDLATLSWSFMIYEGHEGETDDDKNVIIQNLNKIVPVKILAETVVTDGTSRQRRLAIIINQNNINSVSSALGQI